MCEYVLFVCIKKSFPDLTTECVKVDFLWSDFWSFSVFANCSGRNNWISGIGEEKVNLVVEINVLLFVIWGELFEELHVGNIVLLSDFQNLDVLAVVLIGWIVTKKHKKVPCQMLYIVGSRGASQLGGSLQGIPPGYKANKL